MSPTSSESSFTVDQTQTLKLWALWIYVNLTLKDAEQLRPWKKASSLAWYAGVQHGHLLFQG